MPHRHHAIAFAPLLMLLASCQQETHGASSQQAALDAIAETNAKTLQALNTNDLELMNSLVADNHIMMIPNRPELSGREAILASNRNLVESWTNVEAYELSAASASTFTSTSASLMVAG